MTIVVTSTSDAPTTYGDLLDDIALWIARDDLTTECTRFAHLAENDICTDLRVRGMEKSITYSDTNGVETLPSDFNGARAVNLDSEDSPISLTYLPPDRFHAVRTGNGTASYYTIEGETLRLAPASGDVVMKYIGSFDGFVNQTDSNSLISKHFDVYLYCALSHAFSFLRDNEESLKYRAKYNESVEKINRNAGRERFFGNKLIRTGTETP